MNYIKVISRKLPVASITRGDFIDFSNRLTSAAYKQQGFIKSCSYWDVKNSLETFDNDFRLYTLSEWESIDDWEKWLESKNREDVHNISGNPVKEVDHTILYKRLPFNDIFLL
tara:strand:- start:1032 stop:1370 length:339 start_codon:yes stop_codon:yes gene_type:complete